MEQNNLFKSGNNQDELFLQIRKALKDLRYGHVQITVHNSKVVQIDKSEKIRLDKGGAEV